MNLLGSENSSVEAAAADAVSVVSSSESEDSANGFVVIQELQRTESCSSFYSEFTISESTNPSNVNLLVGPSVSASSIVQRFQGLQIQNDENFQFVNEKAETVITFSRESLQKRLKNLIAMSQRNFNGDPEVNKIQFCIPTKISHETFFQVFATRQQDNEVCSDIPRSR